jgi:hypothetical protein
MEEQVVYLNKLAELLMVDTVFDQATLKYIRTLVALGVCPTNLLKMIQHYQAKDRTNSEAGTETKPKQAPNNCPDDPNQDTAEKRGLK